MAEKEQPKRWRCLAVGCNPFLNELTADLHRDETGHKVAKWPVRSEKGKAKARRRNRTGYYDKYNVGAKSYGSRVGRTCGDDYTYGPSTHDYEDDHIFSSEALGQD